MSEKHMRDVDNVTPNLLLDEIRLALSRRGRAVPPPRARFW